MEKAFLFICNIADYLRNIFYIYIKHSVIIINKYIYQISLIYKLLLVFLLIEHIVTYYDYTILTKYLTSKIDSNVVGYKLIESKFAYLIGLEGFQGLNSLYLVPSWFNYMSIRIVGYLTQRL